MHTSRGSRASIGNVYSIEQMHKRGSVESQENGSLFKQRKCDASLCRSRALQNAIKLIRIHTRRVHFSRIKMEYKVDEEVANDRKVTLSQQSRRFFHCSCVLVFRCCCEVFRIPIQRQVWRKLHQCVAQSVAPET